MSRNAFATAALTAVSLALLAACDAPGPTALGDGVAPGDAAAQGEPATLLDVALCAPGPGFTTASTHPFFPMPVGMRWSYEGEEDGEDVELQITVLALTRTIEGVETRVVEEREWEGGELLEVSWNYFAQAPDGSICYFGEDVDIYEDDGVSHEGAWCASTPGFAPGIFLPADPRPGMRYPMEVAPGIAEDRGKIVGSGPVTVPYGRFTETLRVEESSPLDSGKGYKVFAAGTGLVVDGPLELTDVAQTSGEPGEPIPTEQVCGT